MSKPDPALTGPRDARNRARAELARRLTQAKRDFSPAVLKRRAVAETQQAAMAVAQQAVTIASDSQGIIAGTGAALVLWLARKPILGTAAKLWVQARLAGLGPRPAASTKAQWRLEDYWRKLREYAYD